MLEQNGEIENKLERNQNIKKNSAKEQTHNQVMMEDSGSYELERDMYYDILECLKKKNKNMFKLLNRAGDNYKEAIYLYMKRIFKQEEVPIAIWKRKGIALDLNMMRYIHTKQWDA